MNPEEDYTIFQENILEKLRVRAWFIPCIAYNYAFISNRWGCTVSLSERRLGEAYDFWLEDETRTLSEGISTGTQTLDHFKHSAFIVFWLRRMIPINSTHAGRGRLEIDRTVDLIEQQKFFMRYGNELAALLIGLQICLFYEASVQRDADVVVNFRANRLEYLRGCKLLPRTIADFVMVLKHKNMSPHALYLLYKSLFSTLTPR